MVERGSLHVHVFTGADWTDPDHRDNVAYTRSKTLAERATWAELPKLSRPLEWVAIQPGLVLGPVLDRDASASVQVVAVLLNGSLPGVPDFGYAVVDVRDLADLHIRAMTAPNAAGQRYIGAGPLLTMADMADVLRRRAGDGAHKIPTRKLPEAVVRMISLFDPAVRGQLFELGKVRRATSEKAERELGWRLRPVDDTLVDTATSLRDVGAV